ncbi:uncharacterized protein LOC107827161 isoform X5 [Nicotiana tabacum]|uniref:Uncharacterized protein LOC107827161 isoform X5 n=18 Tax=Nicotiana tabacum TaxID=4097 RepID=A0AC58TIR5_TOBAC
MSEIPYNVNEGIPEKGLPKMGQNKLLFCASISFSAEELRRLTMAEGKVDKDSTGEVLDKVQFRDNLIGKVIKDNEHDRTAAIKLLLVGWFS